MRKALSISLGVFLMLAAAAYAKDRPHEGKIVRLDTVANVMSVQGEKGDKWDLYWTETTQLKDGLTLPELREGDKVHFEFMSKDGKMFLTELRRTRKADRD